MGRPKDVGRLIRGFLFSDIGLLCMVVLYCIGGAYLFQYIEYDNVNKLNDGYVKASHDIEAYRDQLADDLFKYKWSNEFENTLDKLFVMYQANVSKAIKEQKYTGVPRTKDDFSNGWDYASAILFTISIVTTIGYGQICPVLPLGQAVFMMYAAIGVPMNLLFLSSNGKVMANWFRNAYNRGCCYICWKQRKATFQAKRRQLIWYLKHGKLKHSDLEQHSAQKLEAKMKSDNEIHLGEVTDAEANKILKDDVDVWCQFVEIMEHIDEDKNVPISLILIVMAVYMFLGCVLFSAWNGWSYAKAAYFCFATLSTIGFGDVVADVHRKGTEGDLQTMVIYVYIYFGLSVVSMSFNLMVVEMKSKMSWVSSALGLSKKKKRIRTEEEQEMDEDLNPVKQETAFTNAPEKFHNSESEWSKAEYNMKQESHRV